MPLHLAIHRTLNSFFKKEKSHRSIDHHEIGRVSTSRWEEKKNESPDLDSFIELSKFILRENDVIKWDEPTVGARNLFRAIVL